MESPKGEVLLERLRDEVRDKGGELAPGWRVEVKTRNSGTSAGTSDAYYFNPAGQRFRSKQEIMRHLESAAQQSKGVTREEAVASAKATAEQLDMRLPLTLDNSVTIVRLGNIDARPSYHSQRQLWPVGYQATWQDAAAGTFQCDILDGGDEGPCFAVSLVPPQSEQPAQSLIMVRNVDLAWRELADMQQAGLDAALAAKTKSQKGKATKAASESTHHSNAAATGLHPDANGMHEDPSVVPDQDAASGADAVNGPEEGIHAEANGHLASEENLAANKQLPPSSSSINMSQKSDKPHHDTTASDRADMLDGNHTEAEEEAAGEPVDEATEAKRQLLVKAAPLAGVWGLDRFGLADVNVLKLIEALQGVEEHCTEYLYVEQRQGWEAEQRRLKKELEKHSKQAAKASKGLEKKGAKLLSLEASAQAKASQAEARMEAKAAAKRKRQEEKQAEKAEMKRAKKEHINLKGPADKGSTPPQAATAAKTAKASPSADAKPKQRRKSGLDKTEKDIQHILYKVIGQVERAYNREQDRAAAKLEKDAAKAQRHREREEQRQAKQASADQSKPKKEPAAEPANQPSAPAAVAVLATDVEDSQLPGAARLPPAADPVGKGLLSPQHISGLMEVREFMARFVDQVPDLDDLEAAVADPASNQQHMQLLTDVHQPLLELVVAEAFEAAINVAGQENLDVRLHEMRYAMPPSNKGDSWPELVRRYFALAATAALVKSTEASGGLDTALGALVGATPLSLLGPFAVLQSLTAGAHTGEPSEAGAARLPLGASRTAPEASQVKQDASALAAAERMMAACGDSTLPSVADQRRSVITCRRMLLELASIKGPKVEGGHASARSLSFDGQSAAAAARTAVPIDLMTVAARVDAGVYSNSAQGIEAFAADVQSVCALFRAATRRSNSVFAAELNSKNASAMADLVSQRMDKLMSQHHGLALPDQAPTPGKKLKKGSSAESSPASSSEKEVNIVEDLARPFAPWEGCCVCWEDEDRKHILLCDKCDAEYHTYCLDPPLEDVPEGEWFCPRCRAELALDSSNEPLHSSLVPTRLMKQEDCYRSLAAALGQQEYHELTPGQRVQIAVLLCNLAASAAVTRSLLTDAEDSKKEMRKEQVALKTKLKREEKERAAAAAAEAAEAQSAPAAEGKEAADKAAKKLEGNARTRAKQEADAAAELQRDLARIEELTVEIRKCSLRKDMLGYDRHWNRYWMLEGSCPEAVTSDDSPASAWVYVESCQPPPGQGQRHPRAPSTSEDEELPLGQLAQQAQHGSPEAQRAKRRKVQIPADQGEARSWGCYKTAEHVGELISFLNYRGVRENHLQKALLRVRPHLPTAASLAAVTAAAEEAKQKAQQRALPKLASSASLAAAAKPAEEDLQPCPTAPAGAVASNPAEATSVIAEKPASSAPSGALSGDPDQASGSTGLAPMEVDTVPAQQSTEAQPAESRPEAGEEADAGKEEDAGAAEADERQLAEPSKQAIVQLPASELERCRGELGAFASGLAPEAFDPVKGSVARRQQWQVLVATAMRSQELMAATLLVENMLPPERLRPHWRICNMPAPSPTNAGSFAAVKLRLHALKAAVKKTVGPAAAATAVTREVPGYAHGGGGYAFRQRKAAGALAEPLAEDSAEEESAAAKPLRAGLKRTRAAVKHTDQEDRVDDDEALARRLQEQEDALAHRGRATRGAVRDTHKPHLAAQKGPSGGSRSGAVRSSSRLKPQAAGHKQRPTTRGSTGMRTTRSRAQEETYSSSSEEEEAADMASESGDSEPNDSSPASSAGKATLQAGNSMSEDDAEDTKGPMVSDSDSDHGSAAQHKLAKRSRHGTSQSRHSSRDSSLARSTRAAKPVAVTKVVEGRKRLRKAF